MAQVLNIEFTVSRVFKIQNMTQLLLVLFSCLTTACSVSPVPDLQRLYESHPLTRDTSLDGGEVETPVILVHGVFMMWYWCLLALETVILLRHGFRYESLILVQVYF